MPKNKPEYLLGYAPQPQAKPRRRGFASQAVPFFVEENGVVGPRPQDGNDIMGVLANHNVLLFPDWAAAAAQLPGVNFARIREDGDALLLSSRDYKPLTTTALAQGIHWAQTARVTVVGLPEWTENQLVLHLDGQAHQYDKDTRVFVGSGIKLWDYKLAQVRNVHVLQWRKVASSGEISYVRQLVQHTHVPSLGRTVVDVFWLNKVRSANHPEGVWELGNKVEGRVDFVADHNMYEICRGVEPRFLPSLPKDLRGPEGHKVVPSEFFQNPPEGSQLAKLLGIVRRFAADPASGNHAKYVEAKQQLQQALLLYRQEEQYSYFMDGALVHKALPFTNLEAALHADAHVIIAVAPPQWWVVRVINTLNALQRQARGEEGSLWELSFDEHRKRADALTDAMPEELEPVAETA